MTTTPVSDTLKWVTGVLGAIYALVLFITTCCVQNGQFVVFMWATFLSVTAGFLTGLILYEALEDDENLSLREILWVLIIFFTFGIILFIVAAVSTKAFDRVLTAFQYLTLALAAIAFVIALLNYIKDLRERVAGSPAPSKDPMKAAAAVFGLILVAMLLTSVWNHFSNPLAPTIVTEKDDSIIRARKKAAAIEAERLRMLRTEREREEERLKQLRSGRPNQGSVTVTIPNYHDVVQVEEEQPQHYPAPNEQQNDPTKGHVPGH